jgi:putative peptidoglycan lipid II flippase
LLVVIVLANGHGSKAALVLYQYGWQVFEAAYAVLAISIAVSVFPTLSVREGADFDQTAAGSIRAVVLTSFLGTAVLLAIAVPTAHFLASRHHQVPELSAGLALFAPGLVGYGLVACLSRVLLAARRTRVAAIVVGAGWLIVIAADVGLVSVASGRSVVAMLALGNTIGLTAAGLALLVAVRRVRGAAALAGVNKAAVTGLAGAIAGAGAGVAVVAALPTFIPEVEAFVALLAAVCAVCAFAVVAYLLDAGDLRAAVGRVRRVVMR